MRLLFIPAAAIVIALSFSSCSSAPAAPATFCDTACLKDTMKFTSNYKLKPYVYISAKDCLADTLLWSYNGMGVNRKVGLKDFLNATIHFNKNFTRCFINDTTAAWLLFNDCSNGRGYSLKLPFNKTADIGRKGSSINNLDHKFSIADNIVAFTDRGNIYLEDMKTGKKAMMTFGQKVDIDYDAIHETVDSVNVTNSRIWVKVKIDNAWKEIEKKITFE